MKKILVMASGNGSNFEAIVEYFRNKDVLIELLCNIEGANVISRAKRLGIKYFIVKFTDTYKFLNDKKYDLYVLAGYMRILPRNVLALGRFIDIHPSLLPEFRGLNAIKRAYNSGCKVTGVTVHYVEEEVDTGEIIAARKCEIEQGMALCELEGKIHQIEHNMYPKIIEEIL